MSHYHLRRHSFHPERLTIYSFLAYHHEGKDLVGPLQFGSCRDTVEVGGLEVMAGDCTQ